MKTLIAILVMAGVASAETKVSVAPASARPGDAVVVTVRGATATPKGDAGGTALQFVRARGAYRAVFAVPLEVKTDSISVEIDSAKRPARVAVRTVTFPEAKLVVEDELATPSAEQQLRIDDDNAAIIAAMRKADGDKPRFVTGFKRPPGKVTSMYGEWRNFNDGHRSQHLGMDVAAKEGAPVLAAGAGVVTLVRDTFLAGNIVVVSHGAGIATAYFHLSAATVRESDEVKRGDEVGKAGQTGRATGPHLHVATRVPNGLVDPASFFRAQLIAPPAPGV